MQDLSTNQLAECEHEETSAEYAVEDRLDVNGNHYTVDTPIEVCVKCDEVIEAEEPDYDPGDFSGASEDPEWGGR